MNYAEINERVAVVVALTAPAVSAGFKAAVGNALKRQTGRSRSSFNPTIRRDRSTGEVWGVSFRTYRYVYMHHHGWAGGQVNEVILRMPVRDMHAQVYSRHRPNAGL